MRLLLPVIARQFTVRVVEKIRQDQEQRPQIRPAIGCGQKRSRGGDSHRQANGGQVIGSDAVCLSGATRRPGQPGIPRSLHPGCAGDFLGRRHDRLLDGLAAAGQHAPKITYRGEHFVVPVASLRVVGSLFELHDFLVSRKIFSVNQVTKGQTT